MILNKQDDVRNTESYQKRTERSPDGKEGKKPFVEPEISVPVDVLEATTFFQVVDSGVSNP